VIAPNMAVTSHEKMFPIAIRAVTIASRRPWEAPFGAHEIPNQRSPIGLLMIASSARRLMKTAAMTEASRAATAYM
jgi:hypothetical protein